jgi:hypothetical protein
MSIVLVFLLVLFVVAAVAFVLGYYLGRRTKAKERQAGFPVLPASGTRESDQR